MKEYVPDCRECGACCVADYAGQEGYVGLWEADVKRLTRHWQRRVVRLGRELDPHLPVKVNRQGHEVCAALRGSVMGQCSCAIYDTRPAVCRAFKPGGGSCSYARGTVDAARNGRAAGLT